MKRRFTLPDGLSLATPGPATPASGQGGAAAGGYPTDALQKGLLLFDGEQELSGEGVGFGVPVLKRGGRAVFAGSAALFLDTPDPVSLTLVYRMDRIERFGGPRRARPWLAPLDLVREALSSLYRRVPSSRRLLTAASTFGRRLLRISTRFEETSRLAEVAVTYTLTSDTHGGCRLAVTADLTGLPSTVTEVVLMNELGAAFSIYEEEGGRTEREDAVGAWDTVAGGWARFTHGAGGAWFELQSSPDPAVPEVRLYRGREVAHGRLAWAGFGYSLRPGPPAFTYTVRFGRGRPRLPVPDDQRRNERVAHEREGAAS